MTAKVKTSLMQSEAALQGSTPRPLSYHVHRTASQQLPVYHLAKRGGNLHQTRVRKIDGDIKALRDDLRRALGLKEEHIVINHLTRHIIIKVGPPFIISEGRVSGRADLISGTRAGERVMFLAF